MRRHSLPALPLLSALFGPSCTSVKDDSKPINDEADTDTDTDTDTDADSDSDINTFIGVLNQQFGWSIDRTDRTCD